jgi:hypothetical protein
LKLVQSGLSVLSDFTKPVNLFDFTRAENWSVLPDFTKAVNLSIFTRADVKGRAGRGNKAREQFCFAPGKKKEVRAHVTFPAKFSK